MDVEHKVTSNTAAIEDVNSNADITDAHVYRNSHSKNAPAILQGKYFVIVKREAKGKISAKCVICKRMISGALYSTGNFLSHISRVHPTILKEVKQLSKRKYSYPETDLNTTVQEQTSETVLPDLEQQTTDNSSCKKPRLANNNAFDKKYNKLVDVKLELYELQKEIRKEQLRQEQIKTNILEIELKKALTNNFSK